jgi:hypothetical protein
MRLKTRNIIVVDAMANNIITSIPAFAAPQLLFGFSATVWQKLKQRPQRAKYDNSEISAI